MKILIGFILLWVTVTASQQGIVGRIYNGYGAHEGQFPYMVHIRPVAQNRQYNCGGSLISSGWVLTAAHCLNMPDPFTIDIYLGMTYTTDPDVGYAVSSPDDVRIHPLFSSTNTGLNDIALIKIPDTPSCTNIRPVRLPPLSAQHESYLGKIGKVAGWGLLGESSVLPVQLQFGRMKIIENEFCKIFKPWVTINQICVDTANQYAAVWLGDSGGPFVLESTGELVGVISGGTCDSYKAGYPSILTSTLPYLEWIKEETGIYY